VLPVAKRQKNLKSAKETPTVAEPSEFDKLLRFVVNFQGRFALAFIVGEDRKQREGVLASLADLLKEKEIKLARVDLTFRQSTDLLSTLKTECRQSDHGAIVVTGVEVSLNDNFLASLNVQRDSISQQITCPILFWVSSFALNLFAREAPDFYDFRQTVFNFSPPQTHDPARVPERLPQTSMPIDTASEDSTNRTNRLLSQLEKYQKDEKTLGLREQLAYAELLEEISRLYQDQRHRTEAIPYLNKALAICTALGDRSRQAAVLGALGYVYHYSDDPTKAAENFNSAIPIHREIGDRLGEAYALRSLGDVKSAQSDYTEAERFYQQALPIHREIGDRLGEANALKSLGDVKRAQSDYAEAEHLYQQALPVHREIGDRLGEANALKSLGNVKRRQKKYSEGEELLLRAMGIFSAIDDSYSQGITLLSLADLYRATGAKHKTESAARRARDLLKSSPRLVARADSILRDLS
jgi:tetratricopeptide (TPR) repeat protein